MILADSMINEYMKKGYISIEPKPQSLQPASIDLRIGRIFELKEVNFPKIQKLSKNAARNLEDLINNRSKEVSNDLLAYVKSLDEAEEKMEIIYKELNFDDSIVLKKRKLYFFETIEKLSVDDKLDEVYLAPRSSLARLLVDLTPLSGEVFYKIKTPFSGKIFGNIVSRAFDLKIYKGQRIMQCVFIEDSPVSISKIHLSNDFLRPKKTGIVDTKQKNELFEKINANSILLHNFTNGNELFLAISMDEIDFSDSKNAGIVLPYYKMKRTCVAPFVDPGYKGKITLTLIGGSIPMILKNGDEVAEMFVHKVKGKVINPYHSRYYGIKTIEEIQSRGLD
jgi:deoxycytidine triphosphate deaminase